MDLILAALCLVAGFVAGVLVYRNNVARVGALVDRVIGYFAKPRE